MARANERGGFQYGICLNRDHKDDKPCPEFESKRVQKFRSSQNLVCEVCKEQLRKVPTPAPPTNWLKIAIVVAIAAAVIGVGGYFLFLSGENEVVTTEPPDILVVEEPAVEEPMPEPEPVQEPVQQDVQQPPAQPPATPPQQPPSSGTATLTFAFGTFEGDVVDGRPHGRGTMTYTCRVHIARHTAPRHTHFAEAGDSFTGNWWNGDIEHGVLTRRNGESITITAGRRPSPHDLRNDRCEQ